MKRQPILSILAALLVIVSLLAAPSTALAQEDTTESQTVQADELFIFTPYPSRTIGFGEQVNLTLTLRAGKAQVVRLAVEGLPEGWTATFRGANQVVDAVFVDTSKDATVDLRLENTDAAGPGQYNLTVTATGDGEVAELPLTITLKDKLPPKLSLTIDGTNIRRGGPDATFSYTLKLKNEGDETLMTTVTAVEPKNMRVTIKSATQEVTELELSPNESRNLTVDVEPLLDLESGQYPFTVQAVAGDLSAELELIAEVVGTGKLSLSGVDGRLSGDAVAGEETNLKLILSNTGTASLRGVVLTSREPSGWKVSFDQDQIAEIPAGQSVEVTARVTPPDNAIAGDYVVTFNAKPIDSRQVSADFRMTVRTSTLWGVAGVGLIALAVAVVGIVVVRFGRR